MYPQVDTADANHQDDEAKRNREQVALATVLFVAPDKPNNQTVKRHSRHRMTRREAKAGLDRKPKTLGTRALNKRFNKNVEARNKHQVHRAAPSRSPAGCKGRNGKGHNDQHDRCR